MMIPLAILGMLVMLLTHPSSSVTIYNFTWYPTAGISPRTLEQSYPVRPAHTDAAPYPGSRDGHGLADCSTASGESIICMFGGQSNLTSFCDLWTYDLDTHIWTFRNTDLPSMDQILVPPSDTYLPGKNSPGVSVYPGSRSGFGFVRLLGTRVRLFGGFGNPVDTMSRGQLCDTWDLDLADWSWTYREFSPGDNTETWWMREDETGTVADEAHPGGKVAPCIWIVGESNDMYVFGGSGQPAMLTSRMWRHDDQLGKWEHLGLGNGDSLEGIDSAAYWKKPDETALYFFGNWNCLAVVGEYIVSTNSWGIHIYDENEAVVPVPEMLYAHPGGRRRPVAWVGPTGLAYVFAGWGYGIDAGMQNWIGSFDMDQPLPTRWNLVQITESAVEQSLPLGEWYGPNAYPDRREASAAVMVGKRVVYYGGYLGSSWGDAADLWIMDSPCLSHRGDLCQFFQCSDGHWTDELDVCSGNGFCGNSGGDCICAEGYFGSNCGHQSLIYYIIGGVSGGAVIAVIVCLNVFVCVCCCACKKAKRANENSSLQQRRKTPAELDAMEEDVMTKTIEAKLTIRKDLFKIPYEEVELVQQIGSGGSDSVIFSARWKGKMVAFKVYRTLLMSAKQHSFEDFEREVEVLSSVRHPNIITFYGASLSPPRVGIVMELATNGEIAGFLRTKSQDGTPVSESTKLRLLSEVVDGMEFLHSRDIIHRDLKSENVLITKEEAAKLIDFGLSRVVDQIQGDMTKRIGTATYMSPEMINGLTYGLSTDVFSFAVLAYIVATEIYQPFGDVPSSAAAARIASDPDFRPSFDAKTLKNSQVSSWLVGLIQSCWSEHPEQRPTFAQIREVFCQHQTW